MSCCPTTYWCVGGVATAGTRDALNPNITHPPTGATGGPFRNEQEAMLACLGDPIIISCSGIDVTCPAYLEFNLTDVDPDFIYFFPIDEDGNGWFEYPVGGTGTMIMPRFEGVAGGNSATYYRQFTNLNAGYRVEWWLYVYCTNTPDFFVTILYRCKNFPNGYTHARFHPVTAPWQEVPDPPIGVGTYKNIATTGDLINGAEVVGTLGTMWDDYTGAYSVNDFCTLTITAP